MDRIEMVEKLREKAGVSYEEAKAALEASDWDLLDAVVLLEKEGKVRDAAYSTKRSAKDEHKQSGAKEEKPKGEGFEKFLRFCGRIIHKGNTNSLVVLRNGERKFSLPVTAFALLLIFAFYFTIPLIIVSLFFGFHYKFSGKDLGKDSINNVMEKATHAAEAVKREVQKEMKDDTKTLKEELKEMQEEIKADLKEIQEEIDEMLEDLEEDEDKK
ncbi:MAG: ubiquitin [Oscillospiraceae bacterium]|nr:ubiquitin [Oscillospiraceae bacterium]